MRTFHSLPTEAPTEANRQRAAIVVNLSLLGAYHDIALRDVGLLVAALALARLASAFGRGRHAAAVGSAPDGARDV